jgi:uncharacterized protein YacL (UPF0231 family)
MMEDNRNEFNAIVSVLGDILVQMQTQHQELVRVFDKNMTMVIDKLTSIETKLDQFNNHEERLRKLEEIVLRKGA